MKANALYYGDNLEILRKHIPSESIDLIYLDPPFNSQADYNVLFKEPTGEVSAAQLRAFTDTWHWDRAAEATYQEIMKTAPLKVQKAIEALRAFIGSNDVMAYLAMMTVRLVELHRVLRPTGSLYLHCDPTASHYLKLVLDTIFGPRNFRNEIVWKRTAAHSSARRYGPIHQTIFYYTRSDKCTWNEQFGPYDEGYVEDFYRLSDPDGRRYQLVDLSAPGDRTGTRAHYQWHGRWPPKGRHWAYVEEEMQQLEKQRRVVHTKAGTPRLKQYLDQMPGVVMQDMWTDIKPISSHSKERLGYETQKPLALLERIIQASSNEGDTVLDPFCGCGTAIVAAHKLNRRWVGIDVTHLAITVMKNRLKGSFGLEPRKDYAVIGEPVDLAGARALAEQGRYQFQYWAVGLLEAQPVGDDRRRGADRGVDGIISFVEFGGKVRRIIVQVKSGHVERGDIAKLKGDMEREKADMGLFLTLEPPTQPMRTEAAEAGTYHYEQLNRDFPRIQICTIEDLLAGKPPQLPPLASGGFAQAPRVRRREGKQGELLE